MIFDCSEVLDIPPHESMLLLQFFDWNDSAAKGAWFDDESRTRAKAGMRTSARGDLLTLSRSGRCLLCSKECFQAKVSSGAANKRETELASEASKVVAGGGSGGSGGGKAASPRHAKQTEQYSAIKTVGRHLKKLTAESIEYDLPDVSLFI